MTSTPTGIAWSITRTPPYSSTAPTARLPIRVTPGKYTASRRMERSDASAYPLFNSAKISSLRRSLRKAWTARIPLNVSTN